MVGGDRVLVMMGSRNLDSGSHTYKGLGCSSSGAWGWNMACKTEEDFCYNTKYGSPGGVENDMILIGERGAG